MAIKADAHPTKDLFIRILVKDIELLPAILDLVDNSVDGALRVSKATDPLKPFEGFRVDLRLSKARFEIDDNCGGIDLDIAVNYAFRFGRPSDVKPTPNSIGQFGVGMKRALFKLGEKFVVRSVTATGEHFLLSVDVPAWRNDAEWEFLLDDNVSLGDQTIGTFIKVTDLYESVSHAFSEPTFEGTLRSYVERRHQQALERGLDITVNGVPVNVSSLVLQTSKDIRSAYIAETLFPESEDPVDVRIYAGVGPARAPKDAGWYLYCNGRLIVGPETTALTGWGEAAETRIPAYHGQFARFRGYVFFSSSDPEKLPWNTTKAGIDQNSESFRWARQRMVQVMRPIIDFLNELDNELDLEEQGRPTPLTTALASAKPTAIVDITEPGGFAWPKSPRGPKKPTPAGFQNITYQRLIQDILKARRVLRVNSNREIGEKTFQYFFERECK